MIARFRTWFSSQKVIIKILLILLILFTICCLCTIPLSFMNSSSENNQNTSNEISQNTELENDNAEENVSENPTDTPAPTKTKAPTDTTAPTNTIAPTATINPNIFFPGTYLVGSEIKPGLYRGIAGDNLFSSCYWERLKDLTGQFDSILANDNGSGQYYIEVKDSDYALKTDCEIEYLENIPEHSGEYPVNITTGTYLIGYDIKPGVYKGIAGEDIMTSCYWERLRGVSGNFDTILANENATGQYYIQVLATDFALTTACDLEWVSD